MNKPLQKSKASFILVIHTTLSLVFYFILENTRSNSLDLTVYLALLMSIWCIFSWRYLDGKLGSPYILFLLFFVVFIYGQLITRILFNYYNPNAIEMIDYYSMELINSAIMLSMFSMAGLQIGAVLYLLLRPSSSVVNKQCCAEPMINEEDEIAILILGWVLTIVSVFPALSSLYKNLNLAGIGGYGQVYSNVSYGVDSITEKISEYFILGLLLLMTAYRKKISARKIIFLLGMGYCATKVILGARGIPTLQIITFIWLWHRIVTPIKGIKVLATLVLVFPASVIFSLIRNMRMTPLNEWIGEFPLHLQDSFRASPILGVLNEMGAAIGPTAASVRLVPDLLSYGYGKSYLFSFGYLIPNVFSNGEHWAKKYADVQRMISKIEGLQFGGSIIQEAFYNFGWYAILFMVFVGFIIALFSEWTSNSDTLIITVLLSYFLSILLWTIRNSFVSIPHGILYYILFPYILFRIIKVIRYGKYTKKKSENEVRYAGEN